MPNILHLHVALRSFDHRKFLEVLEALISRLCQKSISPLFPGPIGPVVTNDLCIG